MGNRIDVVREYVDAVLLAVPDAFVRRCGYLHLYGVAQACALIALKRGENVELATMAGMLHDLYSYKSGDSQNHAEKGAVLARGVLEELLILREDEVALICSAIHHHSAKEKAHSAFDEVLIDADVMQHCLHDVTKPVTAHEKQRFEKLVDEFSLGAGLGGYDG